MRAAFFIFLLSPFAKAFLMDPFYYEEDLMRADAFLTSYQELRLYGILSSRANINGVWIALGENFKHGDISYKLLNIQDICVLLQMLQTQKTRKLCYHKPKLYGDSKWLFLKGLALYLAFLRFCLLLLARIASLV